MCFSPTATYNFLSVEDVNEDKVLDVFFMYKDADASRNTCLSQSKLNHTSFSSVEYRQIYSIIKKTPQKDLKSNSVVSCVVLCKEQTQI